VLGVRFWVLGIQRANPPPLRHQVQDLAAKRLNCTVKQAWGMTELSPGGSMIPDDNLPDNLQGA